MIHVMQDGLVKPLVQALSKLMCHVWYAEYALKVGDSLRESIENGLKETRKCILVLSPNFLSNAGWAKAEFDSVFTREILEGQKVFLPIWHNVTKREVYEYSPRLADKFALASTIGPENLARELHNVLNPAT